MGRRAQWRGWSPVVVAVAVVLLIAAWRFEVGPWADRAGYASRGNPPETPRASPGGASTARGQASSALPIDTERLGGRDAMPGPRDAGATARPKRIKLAVVFRGDCHFGVTAHCAEWRAQAARCDAGDAQVCVQLGELLLTQSPMQPLWGALFLESACALGRDEVCERASEWLAWSRYGYQPKPDPDAPVPAGLEEACADGDDVACGLLEMRRRRTDGDADAEAALAACRAGFRDVCAIVFDSTTDPAIAIAALAAGCDVPDAWLCYTLSGYYGELCQGDDAPAACPPPDPAKAAHYYELACKLDPEILPCRDD